MRITFLGTAAARPTVGRNVSSLVVQREGELMMFDCHACHSPMSKKDWSKDLARSPGQARINNSSLIMVQAIIRAAAPQHSSDIGKLVNQLHIASTSPAANFNEVERTANVLHAQLNTEYREGLPSLFFAAPSVIPSP